MSRNIHPSQTREHILQSALKIFADCGYAGSSIQEIVDQAGVSKPALYYYFKDKEGLFRALVEQAHDQRFALMRAAAEKGSTVAEKLEEILSAVFEFSVRNRELMRLAFATAFSAPGETPVRSNCCEKGRRNFEFVRSLIAAGRESGELSRKSSVNEMAMGIYGQLNSYVMVRLLTPDCPLNRRTAKGIVRLFLNGAGPARAVSSNFQRGRRNSISSLPKGQKLISKRTTRSIISPAFSKHR